jgi:putative membrane protein
MIEPAIKNPDFSEPCKQSLAGIVIMFLDTLLEFVKALIIPLALFLLKAKSLQGSYVFLALLAIFVSIAVFAYLRYLNFTFFLDADKKEFIINEGVFHKSNLTIQLNKIQQVNINQSLLQQMIGVYSLDIDTAGSEKKEAKIKAIDHETAIILKQRLLSLHPVSAQTETEATAQLDQKPLFRLSNLTILKVGITSNYGASVGLLIGFLFGLFQLFRDFSSFMDIEEERYLNAFQIGSTIVTAGVLLAVAIVTILCINIVRTFLRYFDFNIVKQSLSLTINSGLLTKKNTLITPNKVQIAVYSQNYFQKKLDLINIKIKQASFGSSDKVEHKKSDIEIPGSNELEKNEILKLLFNDVPVQGEELIPNFRFLFLQVMIWIVFPLVLFWSVGSIFINPYDYLFNTILPYVLLLSVLLTFEYRHHRLYVHQNFIIKKSGIWDIEHQIIEPYKIQAITANQYFWHKKINIGHLTIHTAAGIIHFKYGKYDQIQRLANNWIYGVETSKKYWM